MNLPPHKVNMAYLKREFEVRRTTSASSVASPRAKRTCSTRDGICPDHTIYQAGHPFYRGTNDTAARYGG